MLGAERAHRLEHRRRAAARRPPPAGRRRASAAEQLRHEPVVAREPSSVATARARDQRRALGVGGVAEAEQHERAGAERVAPDRQRGDARRRRRRAAGRRPPRRGAKPRPSGPSSHSSSPAPARTGAPCPGRRPRAGSRACRRRARAGRRTRAAGTGARPRRRPSARRRRACRTARDRAPARRRPREHRVGADPLPRRSRAHPGPPAAERGERAPVPQRSPRHRLAAPRARWISCSERTSHAPCAPPRSRARPPSRRRSS